MRERSLKEAWEQVRILFSSLKGDANPAFLPYFPTGGSALRGRYFLLQSNASVCVCVRTKEVIKKQYRIPQTALKASSDIPLLNTNSSWETGQTGSACETSGGLRCQ